MKPGDQFIWRSCNWKRVVVEILSGRSDGYYNVRCLEAVKEPYIIFSMVWEGGVEYTVHHRSLKSWEPFSKSNNFNSLYAKLQGR